MVTSIGVTLQVIHDVRHNGDAGRCRVLNSTTEMQLLKTLVDGGHVGYFQSLQSYPVLCTST